MLPVHIGKNGFTFKKRVLINEFWVNDNYFRKDVVYDANKENPKFIKYIQEIGHFPFLERHLIDTIQDVMRE